jgi:hypothetical protein
MMNQDSAGTNVPNDVGNQDGASANPPNGAGNQDSGGAERCAHVFVVEEGKIVSYDWVVFFAGQK